MYMRNLANVSAAPLPDTSSLSMLERAYRLRETRSRIAAAFKREIFDDSAWDMTLELFIAHAEGRQVCVKELILISGESSTSGLRRIDRLQSAGLLSRCLDPNDHRRVRVHLTERGHTAMVLMLEQLFGDPAEAGVPAPGPAKSFVPQKR